MSITLKYFRDDGCHQVSQDLEFVLCLGTFRLHRNIHGSRHIELRGERERVGDKERGDGEARKQRGEEVKGGQMRAWRRWRGRGDASLTGGYDQLTPGTSAETIGTD